MNTNSFRKRNHQSSPPDPIQSKRRKSDMKTTNEDGSYKETVNLPRHQTATMQENLDKLKAENAQLRAKLFHLEFIVLPGKITEADKLLQKMTDTDKVNLKKELRVDFSDVVCKLKESEHALKTAEEKNNNLSSSLDESLCDIKKLHKLEVEALETKLVGKDLQIREVTKMCSSLRLQLATRLENHEKDMLSADAQLQQKEKELANAKKEMEEAQAQWKEALRKLNDEKYAIREQAQKEALELVGVNLEHQKEIHQLRSRLEKLETGKLNPLNSVAQPLEQIVKLHDTIVQIAGGGDVFMEMDNMEILIATESTSPIDDVNLTPAPVSEKSFNCDICSKCFSSKQWLQTHLAAVHPTGPVEVYQCPFCGAQRKYRHDFQAHFNSKQTIDCVKKRPADFNYSLMVLDNYKITLEAKE